MRSPSRRRASIAPIALVVLGVLPWESTSAQPTDAPASPVTWRAAVPAGAALFTGRTLFVLDGALLAVEAHDVVADRRLWRTEIQTSPHGAHDLAAFGPDRLLATTGDALVVVDRASGRVIARHAKPRALQGERSSSWRNAGACALRTSCAFVAIDCEDARPLGDVMRGRMQSRMRFRRDGWDTGCWGFHPDVIGGGNGVSVVSREALQGGDRVIGIDTRSGRTLWERAIATRGYGAGASPDGDLCWVVGHRDESDADAMELRAFACRTGRARFSVPDVEVAAWSATAPAGLFVAGAREAALVDPQRGRPRWRRAIQSGEVALVAGARVHEESPAYASSDRERTLLVLSPSDGNVVTRVPLPAHEGVIGRADGTLIVGESAEIDAAGTRHSRTPSQRVLEVVRGGGTSPATVFLTRPSRRAILRFPSDAWSLGAHHEGGSTYDAVYVWSTTGIGAVRVFVVADVTPSVSP